MKRDDERQTKLAKEIQRRLIDGGDSCDQIAKDLGCQARLVRAVALMPVPIPANP